MSWNKVLRKFLRKSLIQAGEELYLWLDSFGPNEMSLHLGEKPLRPDGYKYFPRLVDDIWLQVRQKGGPLFPILMSLKQALRLDLKRTKRERQLLEQAYFQAGGMLFFIWLYLLAFHLILQANFSVSFLVFLALFQLTGLICFVLGVRVLRKKHFRSLEFFARELVCLFMIRFQGSLSLAVIATPTFTLKKRDEAFYQRMQNTLSQWKNSGQCQESHIHFLQEDLTYLSCDKEQLFLAQIKSMSFCWALLFILPCLFGVSIFGLYGLLDV